MNHGAKKCFKKGAGKPHILLENNLTFLVT